MKPEIVRPIVPPAGLVRIPAGTIERRIFAMRGHTVMLDSDLAKLYRVATKAFNQAVRRNGDRFPDDFMFQLTPEETRSLRSQFVTLKETRGGDMKPKRGRHSKYAPYVFTEHGIAMLSSVLRSKRAVQMNIMIVRAFIHLREMLISHKDLAVRVEKLETGHRRHEAMIGVLAGEIQQTRKLPAEKRRIGFRIDSVDQSSRIGSSSRALSPSKFK
jgi:hypothetical protein